MHSNSARRKKALRSGAEVRAEFHRKGESITGWARENSFHPQLVFEVIAGRRACAKGQSHRIAVLLGMKHGEIPR